MYSFTSRVRYSETGLNEKLTLASLTDYFQDCSTFQSEDLGIGIQYLQKKRQVWVVSAWQIVIDEMPALGEEIRICTSPYAFKGFLGYRNFWMERPGGGRIVYANSLWTLLDIDTMRPVKASQDMHDRYGLEPRLSMEYAPRKIAVPDNGTAREPFKVGRQHLDSNYHVNNAEYVKMASAYLPEGFDTRQMRVEYKGQAHLGDEILPAAAENEKAWTICLDGTDGQRYAVIEFEGR